MAQRYRVRVGHHLGHHGRVLVGGDELELADHVSADAAVEPHIEPIPITVLTRRPAPSPLATTRAFKE